MKDNQAKYPQLRFKGFTDPWEQRKLGKMGYTFTGLSGKTKEDFGHGNAKFVTYMNVFSSPVSNSEMVENVEVDSKQHQVEYGDVFFTTSSETPQEVGMSSVWLETAENIYLNSFCFGYHPMVEFDPYYLAFMLRSPVIRKKFMLLAQGISRYNISKNKVMEMLVPVPEIVEQQKIGSFFKQLDDTITLHQRKLAKLKELKQGYLQKMFPKNGSKFPQLRFAGFADAWEQRKLGDFLTESRIAGSNGLTAHKLTVKLWGKGVSPKKAVYNGSKSTKYYLRRSGQFIYGKLDFLHAAFGIVPESLDKWESTLDSPAFNISPKLNNYFLIFYVLRREFYLRQGEIANGSRKAKRIHVETFLNMPIMVPCFDEQSKIDSILNTIRFLIAANQRKLEKLQELKKGYLQKMFC